MKENTDYKKRELLIECAKKEFLEKGYNRASLRNICANAGVTTGAIYFFFDNKEDLFKAIVDEPLKGLKEILIEHFKEDEELAHSLSSFRDIDLDHSEISDKLVRYIYGYYDSFLILLTAAENTVYEHCVDELVELAESSIPKMMMALNGYTYDEYMTHWMSHITVDAFIHVIRHERDAEVAAQRIRATLNWLVKGWIELALVKEEK